MTVTEGNDLLESWAAWHTERERALREPHGWLSLAGLHWLTSAPAAYPDLPGRWHVADDDSVEITATAADGLEVGGEVIAGTTRVEPRDGEPGVIVTAGARRVEVIRRTDSYALRVRDPEAITLTAFEDKSKRKKERKDIR